VIVKRKSNVIQVLVPIISILQILRLEIPTDTDTLTAPSEIYLQNNLEMEGILGRTPLVSNRRCKETSEFRNSYCSGHFKFSCRSCSKDYILPVLCVTRPIHGDDNSDFLLWSNCVLCDLMLEGRVTMHEWLRNKVEAKEKSSCDIIDILYRDIENQRWDRRNGKHYIRVEAAQERYVPTAAELCKQRARLEHI
jgi:hypothetical protein